MFVHVSLVLLCMLSSFCNHLDREEIFSCFALFVFMLSCECYWSVALPHGAMGWSAWCDCGIS